MLYKVVFAFWQCFGQTSAAKESHRIELCACACVCLPLMYQTERNQKLIAIHRCSLINFLQVLFCSVLPLKLGELFVWQKFFVKCLLMKASFKASFVSEDTNAKCY